MLSELLFQIMLAFLFTHELDAIKRHEWRILPVTSSLPEHWGERVFIWFHVPVFLVVLWFAVRDPNAAFGQVLSGFSIIHIGLHWLFRNHPRNEFKTVGSWALILAAGLFGALHLLAANL